MNNRKNKAETRRTFKTYEKQPIIEHLTKNREKLGLTYVQLENVRTTIEQADTDLTEVVESVYRDRPNVRTSLLRHLSKVLKQNKGTQKYQMIAVRPGVKSRFLEERKHFPECSDVNEFVEHLLKLAKEHRES